MAKQRRFDWPTSISCVLLLVIPWSCSCFHLLLVGNRHTSLACQPFGEYFIVIRLFVVVILFNLEWIGKDVPVSVHATGLL